MRTMERPYIEMKERKENLELSQKLRETRLAIAERSENNVGHNNILSYFAKEWLC